MTFHSPFSGRHIMSYFSSVPIAVRRFYARVAPGDVGLRFSLTLVGKANAVEEVTH
jgi:hypothetical protein